MSNWYPLLAGVEAELVLVYGIDEVVLLLQNFEATVVYNSFKALNADTGIADLHQISYYTFAFTG